jgi:hypothetical protein
MGPKIPFELAVAVWLAVIGAALFTPAAVIVGIVRHWPDDLHDIEPEP